MRILSTVLTIAFLVVASISTWVWLSVLVASHSAQDADNFDSTRALLAIAGYLLSIILLLLTCFF